MFCVQAKPRACNGIVGRLECGVRLIIFNAQVHAARLLELLADYPYTHQLVRTKLSKLGS